MSNNYLNIYSSFGGDGGGIAVVVDFIVISAVVYIDVDFFTIFVATDIYVSVFVVAAMPVVYSTFCVIFFSFLSLSFSVYRLMLFN